MNQPKAKKPEQRKKKPEQRKNLFERNPRKPLVFTAAFFILILVVAFVMRAVYLWQVRQTPEFALLVGDAVTYDAWASRIANGDWLGEGVFYQAPLYPYFLGILYTVFGRDLWAVRLVQIILGAGSCVLLARAGRSFFNRTTTGLLAGASSCCVPDGDFF